jgi:MFS family permease
LTAPHRSFAALRHPGFAWFWFGSAIAMMADNTEHVITYWVIFQKFASPELGGFAVIAHWLPFLLFSMTIGRLAERFDPRRFIVIGMILFMGVSIAWAVLIAGGTLQQWHAMVLLVLHGIAGALWTPSAMLLLHEVVPDVHLQSAIRMNATGRTVGVMLGPALGSALLLIFNPAYGLMINALIYLPLLLWAAPFRRPFQTRPAHLVPGNSGIDDVLATLRAMAGHRVILSMTLLIGGVSVFIGTSYQAQMPGFARDLGRGDPGLSYAMLLAADAVGALVAGIALESRGLLRPHPTTAFVLALLWCLALGGFALTSTYSIALSLLFIAGFVELAFNSMSQSLVQLNSPPMLRGRIIGVYTLASLGMRLFSGISVGVFGGLIGIHASLAISAAALLALLVALLVFSRRADDAR